jgi:ATP-dependent helicase YprA (DUF1998 family)
MTKQFDAAHAIHRIQRDYPRFLQTLFRFRPGSEFSQLFRTALHAEGHFVAGPYLEDLSPYPYGRALNALLARQGGPLPDALGELLAAGRSPSSGELELPPERQLYVHQEAATLAAFAEHKNLVVATGTGSGKTEAFLIPLLARLLAEPKPGIRALLIYPMNALANDQRRRLQNLLRAADPEQLRFGRYTGDTPETRDQARELWREENPRQEPVAAELLSREEMRANPPSILITNYAMLEYLLLRPWDSQLFVDRQLEMIVMDEAHSYLGTQGSEVAQLLRRVKARYGSDRVQCFATSATLSSSSPQALEEMQRFAADLFGAPAESFEILTAQREHLPAELASQGEAAEAQDALLDQLLDGLPDEAAAWQAQPVQALATLGLDDLGESSPERQAGEVLSQTPRIHALAAELRKGASALSDLATRLWGEDPRAESRLTRLLALTQWAEWQGSGAPRKLLPTRYHLFVRGLDGAWICTNPKCSTHGQRASLHFEDVGNCPACSSRLLELLTCSKCGQEYLGVAADGSDTENAEFELYLPRDFEQLSDDEQEALPDSEEASKSGRTRAVTLDLSSLQPAAGPVERGVELLRLDPEKKHKIGQRDADGAMPCAACGARSYQRVSPIQSIGGLHDRGAVVLAESLLAELGEQRKLLVFSDSRQEAAWFAPFLESVHEDVLRRQLIWRILAEHEAKEGEDGIDLEGLGQLLYSWRKDGDLLPPDFDQLRKAQPKREFKEYCLSDPFVEFALPSGRRLGLEGLGFVEVHVTLDAEHREELAQIADEHGLAKEDLESCLQVLLDDLRLSRRLTMPKGVRPGSERFAPISSAQYLVLDAAGDKRSQVAGWIPSGTRNRRLDTLAKLAAHSGVAFEPKELLRDLWSFLTQAKLLIPSGKKQGDHQLHHECLVARRAGRIFRCRRCGMVQTHPIGTRCAAFLCSGEVEELTEAPFAPGADHYAWLYQEAELFRLRGREHTGQIARQDGAQRQKAFQDGQLELLSCSTTFELGVDLGSLWTVFLRNVPPGAANYVQRAGRAGRRLGRNSLVLTYARPRSHDQYWFADPSPLVDGEIRAPLLAVHNERIRKRHRSAELLAAWWASQHGREPDSSFFRAAQQLGDDRSSAAERSAMLDAWLRSEPDSSLAARLELLGGSWQEAAGQLLEDWRLCSEEFVSEIDDIRAAMQALHAEMLAPDAPQDLGREFSKLERLLRAERDQKVLDLFPKRGLLPSYSFPIDSVELWTPADASQGARLALNRDLKIGLSEYAPGARVVADGKIWQSTGVRLARSTRKGTGEEPDALIVREWFRRCRSCKAFLHVKSLQQPEARECVYCGAAASDAGAWERMLEPFGFNAGLDRQQGQPVHFARPERIVTSALLIEAADAEDHELQQHPDLRLQYRILADQRLHVISRGDKGNGYWICERCGHARSNDGKKHAPHQNRYGRPCGGRYHSRPLHLSQSLHSSMLLLRPQQPSHDSAQLESALAALLRATADLLPIQEAEIASLLRPYVGATGSSELDLVIHDQVPGGAGHAERILDQLPEIVQRALELSRSCACQQACYRCLKSYRNQSRHGELDRGLAAQQLETWIA